jgi:hypothetical protein
MKIYEDFKSRSRKLLVILFPDRPKSEVGPDELAMLRLWGLRFAVGLVLLIALAALTEILVWVSSLLSPWAVYAVYVDWAAVILIVAPLLLARRMRGFARSGLMIAASIFAATLWIGSIQFLADVWGALAVFVGLGFAGIGVVPLALIAALARADGGSFLALLLLTGSALGTWYLSRRIAPRHTTSRQPSPAPVTDETPAQ